MKNKYGRFARSSVALLCAASLLLAGVPAPTGAAAAATAVTTDYLNLRQGAGTNTEVLLTLGKNVTVTILDNSNGTWAKVKTSSGRTGYCCKDYLSFGGSSGSSSGSAAAAVTTTALNMRSGASLSSGILAILSTGTSLKVLDNSNSQWVKVQTQDGRQGWCYRTYLKVSAPSGKTQGSVTTVPTGMTATTTDYLNLREGAGMNYNVILTLSTGSTASVLDNSNSGWVKVLTSGGKQGWCSRQYLKISGGSSGSSSSSKPSSSSSKPSSSSSSKPQSQSSSSSPSSSSASNITGATVTADILRLREGPTTSSRVLDSLLNGTSLKVLAAPSSGWVKVQTPSGKTGYVSAEFVKLTYGSSSSQGSSSSGGSSSQAPAGGITGATVTADVLRLREGPSTSSRILDSLPDGTSLKVLAAPSSGWVKVQTSSGKVGYVSTEFVKLLTGGSTGSDSSDGLSLSASSMTVPQGKTLWLQVSGSASWTSSNPSVAKVTNGYVYAVSPGTAKITASSGSASGTCAVTVTAAEPVRTAFASPNIAAPGETVTFKAVTDGTRDGVQFRVTASDGNVQTLNAACSDTNSVDGVTTKVWTASCSFSAAGVASFTAYSSVNGSRSQNGFSSDVMIATQGSESVTTGEQRRASDKMISMISKWEGYSSQVYADQLASSHVPTIGYGYTLGTNAVFYDKISETEAWALLVNSINNSSYTTELNRMISANRFRMNQNQADALISFAYNVGAGYFNSSAEMDFRRIMKNAVVPPTIPSGGLAATVTYDSSLRDDHTLYGNPICRLSSGTAVTVITTEFTNTKDGWYQIRLSNGTTGWINSGYVNLSNSDSLVHDLNYTNAYAFGTELILWNQAGGKFYPGLFYRRLGEANVYNYGDYSGARYNKYNYTYPSSASDLD